MHRVPPLVRLCVWLIVAVVLGFVVEKTPGMRTFELPEGRGTIAVPDSLEGWSLERGEGDVLLRGATRLNLMEMEVVKVPAKSEEDLLAYIRDRHDRLWREKEDYQPRLKGEVRRFGLVPVPKGFAVYDDRLPWLPVTVRYVLEDAYFRQRGEYLRITLRYPEPVASYVEIDEYIIAGQLKLAP